MRYKITFRATVERTIEVPDGLDWSEAYRFARDRLSWFEIAHSPAAVVTIDTSAVIDFERKL